MSGLLPDLPAQFWLIIAAAAVTYATRFGGHLVLSRFRYIPPRVNAALDAVPAAVITTLVAPAMFSHGPAEAITIVIALLASLRFGPLVTFAIGWAAIVALRAAGI